MLNHNKFYLVIEDNLSLEQIFEKIYFENYLYNDIKEYLFPALRKVKDGIYEFLDILLLAIKTFSLVY